LWRRFDPAPIVAYTCAAFLPVLREDAMSTMLAPEPAALIAVPAATSSGAAKPVKRWLVGPWFDLFFLANFAWPIAALLYYVRSLDQESIFGANDELDTLTIFQVYFLSTPHRWITLVLVFCDSDRFWKSPAKFGGLGLGLVALALALVAITLNLPYLVSLVGFEMPMRYVGNSLILLTMLDYVWNAWHFAAQHAGISRIYGRMARPEQSLPHAEFEKMALRVIVLWVFFRFAFYMAMHSGYGGGIEGLAPWLPWLDPLAFVPGVILLARELKAFRAACLGRLLYMGSVMAIYAAQLVAIHLENTPWMMAFFFAGAIFHAVEYLAICNWSVQKRTTGIWNYQITRTGLALFAFMAILGAANWLVNAQSVYAWQLITLLVSFLHYGYDGIIWKAKPAAKAS
jgi:hypothetical protein